jgi:hypothetical protein
VMVDTSLGGCGSWFGLVGSVGAELDHLVGAAARHGADELAGEEDLEHGGWRRTVTTWPARCRPAETCW